MAETTSAAAAASMVERDHTAGFHTADWRPTYCPSCWPNGAPIAEASAAPPSPPASEPAADPPRSRILDARRRGEGFEPLRAGLERYRASITVVDDESSRRQTEDLAADGGPLCGVCGGGRFVRRDVSIDDPDFGRAIPCSAPECVAFVRGRGLERFWRDVPVDVREATLGTYPQRCAEQRRAIEMVQSWLTWPSFWLYLWGGTGRGKTGLAVAAVRELGRAADFVKVPDMLRRISSTYDRDTRERDRVREVDLLERLWTMPVLVLDEFGVEAPTAWAEERIYQVVDGRSTDPELVTIITSNLPPARLERRLARVDAENGERVVSRILGRTGPFVVEVGGPDLRLAAHSHLREVAAHG